jgi:chromosome segregation ATPase
MLARCLTASLLAAGTLGLFACGPQQATAPAAPAPAEVALPADDGSPCYRERARYYQAVEQARATEQIYRFGGALAQGLIVSGLSNQLGVGGAYLVGELARQVIDLQAGLAADQARIAAYNASFDELVACREREARRINRDVRRRGLPREQAEARMAVLRDHQVEDIRVARETNAVIAERTAKFEGEVNAAKQKSAAAGTQQEEVAQAQQTLQTNQQELSRSEQSVEVAESRVTALEVSALDPARGPRTRAV